MVTRFSPKWGKCHFYLTKNVENGHLFSFSIYWNLQNIKSHIYDMAMQGQIILLTCVLFINIARASNNFKMKYTKNGKIKKKNENLAFLVYYYWKSQPNWDTPLMFCGNPTLGCLIHEIKWVGKLRQFSENQIKLDN